MSSSELRAPVSGVITPLSEVPDEVFARKLAGDGVAIDPTSEEIVAPCDGVVTQLHQNRHALSIASDEGVETLIHVGLDTVLLEGRGFAAEVKQGARVVRGQLLLRFDADLLARAARSLLTEVVVQNATVKVLASGVVKAGEPLLQVQTHEPVAFSGEHQVSRTVRLPNAQGLHARPAAVLAARAQKYAASVRLFRGAASADAKSLTALMGLSTKRGDEVHLEAEGPDAAVAISDLVPLLESGCGEAAGEPAPREARRASPKAADELGGVPASEGLAAGVIVQHRGAEPDVRELGGTPQEERTKLASALREAALELEALAKDAARAPLLHMQQALLKDPELTAAAEAELARGMSAAYAWHHATGSRAKGLEQLDQPLLRERAADLRDVGRRVLTLLGAVRPAELDLPPGAVVVAEELTPSELAALDTSRLAALCTTTGSPTSHVAILARALGIPAICAIDEAALSLPPGTKVLVDGTNGVLQREPPAARVAEANAERERRAIDREREQAAARAPARTRDGHRIEVFANISSLADAKAAVEGGAEGVGLLRSEYLYFGHEQAPGEEQQAAVYRAVAEALGPGRPLVIRTLDVGGDKPLPYLPLPAEKNPFLGVRGIRVSLAHPELFRAQLRAIASAAPHGDVRVMFPMISGLDELRAARRMLDEERRGARLKLGIMIEVPSAVAMAAHLGREVDFFSIGTNDLTQYTLAMDRGHPGLARQADALHPAVLKAIAQTVSAARKIGCHVAVCGGVASEPLAVPLLIGLGVGELSVSVPAIAAVKAAVARFSLEECEGLACDALELDTPAEVRRLLAGAKPGPNLKRVGT